MTNRIRQCHWYPRILDPTLAEVAVAVYPERLASRTQVRGQVTGPHCEYSTTIEVAYPWRETSRTYEKEGEPHISARAIIPEPSLWEPQTPFLYEATVELFDNGRLSDKVTMRLGLRDLKLGGRGFLLNGRPFTIHGVARERFTPEDLPELRQAGFDTLLARLGSPFGDLFDAADRLGFLVIGWLAEPHWPGSNNPWGKHPSALSVVVAAEAERGLTLSLAVCGFANHPAYEPLIGLEVTETPGGALPGEDFDYDFLVCDRPLLADLASNPLPKLVRLFQTSLSDAESQALLATPGVCGWVLDPFL